MATMLLESGSTVEVGRFLSGSIPASQRVTPDVSLPLPATLQPDNPANETPTTYRLHLREDVMRALERSLGYEPGALHADLSEQTYAKALGLLKSYPDTNTFLRFVRTNPSSPTLIDTALDKASAFGQVLPERLKALFKDTRNAVRSIPGSLRRRHAKPRFATIGGSAVTRDDEIALRMYVQRLRDTGQPVPETVEFPETMDLHGITVDRRIDPDLYAINLRDRLLRERGTKQIPVGEKDATDAFPEPQLPNGFTVRQHGTMNVARIDTNGKISTFSHDVVKSKPAKQTPSYDPRDTLPELYMRTAPYVSIYQTQKPSHTLGRQFGVRPAPFVPEPSVEENVHATSAAFSELVQIKQNPLPATSATPIPGRLSEIAPRPTTPMVEFRGRLVPDLRTRNHDGEVVIAS